MNNIKKIALWGYGREGKSSYKHLKSKYPNAEFTIISSEPVSIAGVEYLDEKSGNHSISSGEFNLVVRSPVISIYKPEILAAKEKGTIFTSATNLWFEANPNVKTIAVTGTKGKSTTSNLICYMLRSKGLNVTLAGNIGRPILDTAPPKDYMIIELSSYQIADIEHFPDYLIITNLFPEHLPWHNGLNNYYEDKLRIARNPHKTVIIANYENEELTKRLPLENIHWYETDEITENSLPLKGRHNLSNFSAAMKLMPLLGIEDPNFNLENLEKLPHRLEEFGKLQGNTCVNDSISTIPESTMAALNIYKGENISLILGGQNRGQDYNTLIKELKNHNIKQIATVPETGNKIHELIKKHKLDILLSSHNNITEAFNHITKRLPDTGIILLSPAAPSYTEFNNFEERGKKFMNLCASHPDFIKI